ncbi:MAG: hypothetical protein QOF78_2454 [Phycisphaerales bacterium]|nr:hypothetical protein [Phycisphaerales bacterium]
MTRPGLGAMIALTILGGVLRFVRLGYPPLLWDEAATYTRVAGTFRELVEILRHDGFAPLHYELYWLIGRMTTLTPFVMRLVPALAGTLMIPAIYFLARQVTSRRVATLASALTAFSAYLLIYSRDAKMYMHLWLFAVLFIACLLWWMRTDARQQRLAWLTFVACGSAMNGLHALGLCVVGVALVIVLTHPLLTRRKFLAALAGMTIACAGLAGHYALFNRWGSEVRESGWRRSGLDWIGQRNREFSKPVLMWDTTASWLLAYRAPRPPIDPPKRVIQPVIVVSAILGVLLVAGAMPWPPRFRDDDPEETPEVARRGRGRGVMWMAAWVLLPAIGFYLVSFGLGRDVWNARYLAIVWPAAIILVALSIQRLPLPWLRAGAIALLIGANLVQYALRVTVNSAAPVDQVAADIASAAKSGGTIETIVAVPNDPEKESIGGSGGIYDYPGRYYLSIALGTRHSPRALRDDPFETLFHIDRDVGPPPATVENVIVWTDGPREASDIAARAVGPGWTRQSADEFSVRDFWNWRRLYRCTRSVYVRNHGTPRPSRQNRPG